MPKTNEAILPADSDNRFVYDKNLGRWIDTTESAENVDPVQDQIAKGPPKIPLMSFSSEVGPPSGVISPTTDQTAGQSQLPASINPNQLSFLRSKQKRYVDILQTK